MRIRSAILAASLAVSGLLIAAPTATAAVCKPTWTIGIGGLGDDTSNTFAPFVDQTVGYWSFDTRSGVNELNRLISDHRNACPGDHIKAIGHSGGAAALHVWLSENGHRFGNINAILLSDPKRPGGPAGPGFAGDFPMSLIPPLAGTDSNYGGVPTVSVCDLRDHICASHAGWQGYLFEGAHANYQFNPHAWSNWGSGSITY